MNNDIYFNFNKLNELFKKWIECIKEDDEYDDVKKIMINVDDNEEFEEFEKLNRAKKQYYNV